ncbi:MAG: hypothetical protein H0V44_14760 [Planctomycetes bacterium]|nr:hypothetical protein [Planctomycetota bacterium]
MYSKSSFLKNLRHEAKVLKHLAAQVPAGAWDYRPTPAQRSTLELLRYLSHSLTSATAFATTGEWAVWEKLDAESKLMEAAGFAKAIDRQTKAVERLLAKETDKSLQKKQVTTWSGQKCTLGEGLIEMVLKPLTAYRMQLFLYAKASGASHIGTSDCWRGKAAKPKKASASG